MALAQQLAALATQRLHELLLSYLSCALLVSALGANVVPVGGKHVRRLLRLLILALSTADMGLYVLLFVFGKVYWCESALTSKGVTRCDALALPSLYSLMFIFPGAFAAAPLLGAITGLAELAGAGLARVYAAWSRLAVVNTIVALALYSRYKTPTTEAALGWVVGLLVASRLIQVLVADQFVAHVERKRFNRGWDGLTTALATATDVEVDLVY